MMLCALVPVCVAGALATPSVPVGPGVYHADRTHAVEVARFRLDVTAVTNAEYLLFVEAHPSWRRGAIDALYADDGYLARWAGPLDLGDADPSAPVTGVSWFAARAYCAARGARLPTIAQWELADAGAPTAQAVDWYARPSSAPPPRVGSTAPDRWGVRDLDGVVWEWVDDYASVLDGDAACGGGAVGAADPSDYTAFMRTALRSSLQASYTMGSLGFRCAQELSP